MKYQYYAPQAYITALSAISYFLYISPAARLQKVYNPRSGYHIEDISPVPQGTDIINILKSGCHRYSGWAEKRSEKNNYY